MAGGECNGGAKIETLGTGAYARVGAQQWRLSERLPAAVVAGDQVLVPVVLVPGSTVALVLVPVLCGSRVPVPVSYPAQLSSHSSEHQRAGGTRDMTIHVLQ